MAARNARGAPAPQAPARGALRVALAAALLGLALSVALARLYGQAHAGVASFCDLSVTVSCDRVALSRYSVVLGLPVAVWGVMGYGLGAALAAAGLRRRRPSPTWPSGLLLATGAAAASVSVALALVSKLAIGAWCLLCAASWATALVLLAAAWRACRPQGAVAAAGRTWPSSAPTRGDPR